MDTDPRLPRIEATFAALGSPLRPRADSSALLDPLEGAVRAPAAAPLGAPLRPCRVNHHQCLVGAGRARAYVDHLKGFVGPGRHASADVLARLGGSNPRRSLGIDEGVFDVPPDFDEPLPD